MHGFSQAVEHWQAFYNMVGTAAATLLGLVFVAISLNLKLILQDENISLSALASETINNFASVLLIAIIFLVPDQTPHGIGIPLFVIGAYGLVDNVRLLMTGLRHRKPHWRLMSILYRFALPLVALLTLIVVSIFVMRANVGALSGMVFVIVVFLVVATSNSWVLLFRIHKPAQK